MGTVVSLRVGVGVDFRQVVQWVVGGSVPAVGWRKTDRNLTRRGPRGWGADCGVTVRGYGEYPSLWGHGPGKTVSGVVRDPVERVGVPKGL